MECLRSIFRLRECRVMNDSRNMAVIARGRRQDLKLFNIAVGSKKRMEVRQLREQNSRKIVDEQRGRASSEVCHRWAFGGRCHDNGCLQRGESGTKALNIERSRG